MDLKLNFVIWWAWMFGIALVLIGIVFLTPPLKRRYLGLKLALLSVKVRQVCCPAIVRLQLMGELVTVNAQLAINELYLRYLLLKRFLFHNSRTKPKRLQHQCSPTDPQD